MKGRTIADVQAELLRLKAETGVCVLAHSYQSPEILEVADITGDSYYLSRMATQVNAQQLLVCGVHFMAETVKLLNPEKTVYEANPMAGCPMAEQFSPAEILAKRAAIPDCAVVAYVNTTAALKAVSDVCVTSSSAVTIVERLPQTNLLFVPDCNLGAYVQAACPQKHLFFLNGGCPYHGAVTEAEVAQARALHPQARLLVHPECPPAVTAAADYVGATSGILQEARTSSAQEFVVGTELSIALQLSLECPDKRFYPLSRHLICPDMRATTLADLERVLRGVVAGTADELTIPAALQAPARHALDEMLRLGG